MTLQSLFERNKQYEDAAVLDLDAILHKATQETCEFIEAVEGKKREEVISEIGDALTNILSVQYRLSPDLLDKIGVVLPSGEVPLSRTIVYLGKWNDAVQKHRNIYSRSHLHLNSVITYTQLLVGTLLRIGENYLGDKVNLQEVCAATIDKFGERVDRYGKPIEISDYIRNIPDFPKPGIQFKDITPLLQDPRAFRYTVQRLSELAKNADVIVGLDARGFLFGAAVAERLGKPFVPVRKKGKLPYTTIEDSYSLEYGEAVQTMHIDAIESGQKVVIIDDLLATGGTAVSAYKLVEKLGGVIEGYYFVIELDELNGREKLKGKVESLVHY